MFGDHKEGCFGSFEGKRGRYGNELNQICLLLYMDMDMDLGHI